VLVRTSTFVFQHYTTKIYIAMRSDPVIHFLLIWKSIHGGWEGGAIQICNRRPSPIKSTAPTFVSRN